MDRFSASQLLALGLFAGSAYSAWHAYKTVSPFKETVTTPTNCMTVLQANEAALTQTAWSGALAAAGVYFWMR